MLSEVLLEAKESGVDNQNAAGVEDRVAFNGVKIVTIIKRPQLDGKAAVIDLEKHFRAARKLPIFLSIKGNGNTLNTVRAVHLRVFDHERKVGWVVDSNYELTLYAGGL